MAKTDDGVRLHVEETGSGVPVVFGVIVDALELCVGVVVAVLAFRWHLRVELEWLEVQLDVHRITDAVDRLLQRLEPDRAPRAGDVRDKVDANRRGHGGAPWKVGQ